MVNALIFYDGQLNVLTWDNAEVDVDIHTQIKTLSIPCLDNAMTACPENTVMHSGAGGKTDCSQDTDSFRTKGKGCHTF